jgi:hypothetical protein
MVHVMPVFGMHMQVHILRRRPLFGIVFGVSPLGGQSSGIDHHQYNQQRKTFQRKNRQKRQNGNDHAQFEDYHGHSEFQSSGHTETPSCNQINSTVRTKVKMPQKVEAALGVLQMADCCVKVSLVAFCEFIA